MDATKISALAHAHPFKAFRLHLGDGTAFDVPHGNFIFVKRHRVDVVTKMGDDNVVDDAVMIAPEHINRVEIIDPGKTAANP